MPEKSELEQFWTWAPGGAAATDSAEPVVTCTATTSATTGSGTGTTGVTARSGCSAATTRFGLLPLLLKQTSFGLRNSPIIRYDKFSLLPSDSVLLVTLAFHSITLRYSVTDCAQRSMDDLNLRITVAFYAFRNSWNFGFPIQQFGVIELFSHLRELQIGAGFPVLYGSGTTCNYSQPSTLHLRIAWTR